MKRFFTLLIALLVVLQVFFIPAAASEWDQEEEPEDLLHSSVVHDLDVHTSTDLLALVGGSFGGDNIRGFEVFTAAYERVGNYYRFYIYLLERVRIRADYDSPRLVKVGLKNFSSNSTVYVDAPIISTGLAYMTTIYFDLPMTSPCFSRESDAFSIEIVSLQKCGIGWSDPVYEGYREKAGDSIVVSNLGLTFSYNDIMLVSKKSVPMLDVEVTLMCDRVSSDHVGIYNQLNTAAFILPDYFTDHYGTLVGCTFKYDLYHDVPMFVVEAPQYGALYSFLKGNVFNSSDFDLNFTPEPVFRNQARFPGDLHYNVNWWIFHITDVSYTKWGLNWFSPYFTFAVDEISHDADGGFDFTPEEALARWEYIKNHSAPPYALNSGGTYYHFEKTLHKTDLYNTVSAAEGLNWATQFSMYVLGFGRFVDDSIVDLPAIEHVESDPADMTDSTFEGGLYIDPYFKDTLADMYDDAEASNGLLTLLRYCLTPYAAAPVNSITAASTGTSYSCDGYIAVQDIIDDFVIISFEFEQVVTTYDGPELITTTTLVHSDPVSFVGGGESPESMLDQVTTDGFHLHFLSAPKSVWDWIKRIGLIVLAVVVLIVIYKVVTLIVSIASLFKHRRNDDPDPKPKKKRFRFFRRRR